MGQVAETEAACYPMGNTSGYGRGIKREALRSKTKEKEHDRWERTPATYFVERGVDVSTAKGQTNKYVSVRRLAKAVEQVKHAEWHNPDSELSGDTHVDVRASVR